MFISTDQMKLLLSKILPKRYKITPKRSPNLVTLAVRHSDYYIDTSEAKAVKISNYGECEEANAHTLPNRACQ